MTVIYHTVNRVFEHPNIHSRPQLEFSQHTESVHMFVYAEKSKIGVDSRVMQVQVTKALGTEVGHQRSVQRRLWPP